MQTFVLCFLCFNVLISSAQDDSIQFKVIAFYSASWDAAHISFAHECNRWFPEMAEEYNFSYDSTKNWSNLNPEFLSQYQVVMFLDDQPPASQRDEFEEYMRNGGAWMGFHVCAFNQDPSAWDWYYNQFLGMGSYTSNTWAPSTAVLRVEDTTQPTTINLPEIFTASVNEWYAWENDLRTKSNIKIICSIDTSSFPLGDGSGAGGESEIWHEGYYPVVWSNTDYNMMYLNMGHNAVNYSNNTDLSHTFDNEIQNQLVLDELFWLASQNMPNPRATKLSFISPENGELFLKPATIPIEISAADSDGVAIVQFFNGNIKLAEDSIAPFMYTWENVGIGSYNLVVKAIDSLGNVVAASVSVDVQGEGAYNDIIAPIPGKIEAENFDYGGEGMAYHDAESSNQGAAYRPNEGVDIEEVTDTGGGFNVGWTNSGEWLTYTVNVTEEKKYIIQARVAAANTGKKFHIEFDGEDITGTINVPKTGGWQTWQTVNVVTPILTTGQKEMRLFFDTDGFNLNFINFSDEILTIEFNEAGTEMIYPNPSDGMVYFRFIDKNQDIATLSIFDNSGRKIKTFSLTQHAVKEDFGIDFSGYAKGVYYGKLNNNQGSTFKVLIR